MIALINKQYVFEYGNSNDLAKSLSVYKKNNQLLVKIEGYCIVKLMKIVLCFVFSKHENNFINHNKSI